MDPHNLIADFEPLLKGQLAERVRAIVLIVEVPVADDASKSLIATASADVEEFGFRHQP
jgi:hypothetical protein